MFRRDSWSNVATPEHSNDNWLNVAASQCFDVKDVEMWQRRDVKDGEMWQCRDVRRDVAVP